MNTARKRVFIFGDMHLPFHHKVALAVAMHYCILYKPDVIVQVGDLRDWYSASRFSRKVNLMTPKEEDTWAQYYSDLFWGTLVEKLPKAEKYQLLGNHCVRPMARIMEKAPEFEEDMLEALKERYTFDGVKTIYDPREELDLYGVRYIHGYLTKLGDHATFNQMPVVCGHSHRGGSVFIPMKETISFELNAGYLADPSHPALSYTMQKKATRWTHGFGLIDGDGPKFVALSREDLARLEQNSEIKKLIF